MKLVTGLAAIEWDFFPLRALLARAGIERAGHAQKRKRDAIPRMIGQAEFARSLGREQENGLRAGIGKLAGGTTGEIDEGTSDGAGRESAHGVAAHADAIGVKLARECGDALLQLGK